MKDLKPREAAVLMLIFTVCIILVIIEAGIVIRVDHTDVAESRALLADILKMVIALTAGFFMGKKDEEKPPT